MLAWWANIFVALGLTATFLGIIAALVGAVGAMSGGADMTRMQQALIGLLTITAAKFWTSIGGVLASIILRWFDRRWHSATTRRLEALCDRLEYGTLFSPPQRIAADQLRELRQQSVAMTEFSTQLAASIGDSLQRNLAPVVQGLGGIQSSLNDFRKGGFSEIGKNVGEKINEHAGAQMSALAEALNQMTATLAGVTSGLDGASERASEQIAHAAAQFATASEEMLRAVRELVQTARTENGAAMKGALEDFAAATGAIRSAFDEMRDKVGGMGVELTENASDVARRNADVLRDAADALAAVAGNAQSSMSDALKRAIEQSAEASSATISNAFAAFGERFEAASAGLVTTLTTTAGRMEALVGAIERSTGAASDHAGKLADAGREAQAVSTMLGKAANDVAGAAGPIREAVGHISTAAGRIERAASDQTQFALVHREVMEGVADSISRTAGSATQAWDNYRTRFTEVDEALGKALEQIRNASGEHATALNTQVGKIDSALAAAVERLAGALDDIKDLANALEDVRGRYEQAAE